MSKKIKIEIKHCLTGAILFEYECVDNTIAKTVQEAVNQKADLNSANLSFADLSFADLRSADLRFANLSFADLRSADLRFADLRFADLRFADLRFADLRFAKNSDLAVAMTRILPEGDIIGWKKCRNNVIVKLKIPAEAKRSHAFGRKCRAEYAEVLEIFGAEEAVSSYDNKFVYHKGDTVKPVEPWDDNWLNECGSGIHFFIARLEAEHYTL